MASLWGERCCHLYDVALKFHYTALSTRTTDAASRYTESAISLKATHDVVFWIHLSLTQIRDRGRQKWLNASTSG